MIIQDCYRASVLTKEMRESRGFEAAKRFVADLQADMLNGSLTDTNVSKAFSAMANMLFIDSFCPNAGTRYEFFKAARRARRMDFVFFRTKEKGTRVRVEFYGYFFRRPCRTPFYSRAISFHSATGRALA